MTSIIESNIIGQSALIEEVKSLIKVNAQYPAPVLITGETGTGKELAARALHYCGAFADKPFVAINCSTFTDELFASELFGYKKGAFTDAKTDKEGLLTAAKGGSIFLDEIDSLSMKSQAVLLRLLQESEFRAVGSNQTEKADVRIIAAANCNLCEKIRAGEFRQDLYFRLFILTVIMPPLRERTEDIGLLVAYFINKLNRQYGLDRTTVSESLLNKLKQHQWPGNVRELENTIHRYYLLCSGPIIDQPIAMNLIEVNEQPQPVVELCESSDNAPDVIEMDFCCAKRKAIESFERSFVLKVLNKANGNVTKAAGLCGKERSAFGKLIKKYDIKRDEMRVR
jgi:DNA-binding NtrC family response regulator